MSKTKYPFIRYVPIAAVKYGSHVSGRAMKVLWILGNRVSTYMGLIVQSHAPSE